MTHEQEGCKHDFVPTRLYPLSKEQIWKFNLDRQTPWFIIHLCRLGCGEAMITDVDDLQDAYKAPGNIELNLNQKNARTVLVHAFFALKRALQLN